MLVRDGADFTVGRSRFVDHLEGTQDPSAKIFVKIEPESFGALVMAQLDTGAAWSILDARVAEALDLFRGSGQAVSLETRYGVIRGRLERIQVELVADEGDSVSVSATVLVSPEWTHGSFVGYGGLLERIRFAIDPNDRFFYFGL
jgi:hypothetical protein